MRMPALPVGDLDDCTLNFEALQAQSLYCGQGAPAFVPDEPVAYYFRLDTPTVANQRLYVWSGTAWTGIV